MNPVNIGNPASENSIADLNADTVVYTPLDAAPIPHVDPTVPGQAWNSGVSDSNINYITESSVRSDAYIDAWIFSKAGLPTNIPLYGLAAAAGPGPFPGGSLGADAAGLSCCASALADGVPRT